jgi:sucrose phosphorylase
LETELKDETTIRFDVLSNIKELLEVRTNEKAFHPNSPQQVVLENKHVFALVRTNKDNEEEKVVVLVNVANEEQTIELSAENYGLTNETFTDLVSSREYTLVNGKLSLTLQAYDALWLKG